MSLSSRGRKTRICTAGAARTGAMNQAAQIVLALLGFMALVGGVTFISQYQTAPPVQSQEGGHTTKPDVGGPVELTFAEPAALDPKTGIPTVTKKWDFPAEEEVDLLSSGHYDFRFENPNTVPVNIGIHSIGCKCTSVSLCLLTPEEMKRYLLWAHGVPTFEAAMAHAGILAGVTQIAAEELATQALDNINLHWSDEIKTTEVRANPNKVVATVAPGTAGLLRMNYQGKATSASNQRLVLELWTQATEGPRMQRALRRLEYSVHYVPAVQVIPGNVDLEDLGLGEQKSFHIPVWSSTRADFALTAHEAHNDPCFTCTCTPATWEERQPFAESGQGHVRALALYHVQITVKERVSDKIQMDLGPFQRRIVLKTDPEIAETSVLLSGNVRGDVVVGAPEDNGKIKLSSFPSSNGTKKLVHLTTLRPNMDLKVEKVEPETLDYLHVKSLKKINSPEDGKSFWELDVEVPPGCPPGALPRHSAIVLIAPGDPPRHVRIPVLGTAYQ
jgi:hypothetical protein